jgi:histidyl-tRNA synthetase
MLARLWKILGIGPVRLEINCLGEADERARHRADLIAYFESHVDALDEDAKRRLHTNPLRILDTKNPALADIVAHAPRITAYLGESSRAHFEGLQRLLTLAGVPFTVNPRLVRGLDYYNLTVFEWITDALGAQGTICGGGRYDPLVERMGGRASPSCGFAIGVERVIELLRDAKVVEPMAVADVYVAHQGGATAAQAFVVAERLRDAGLDALYHAGEGSLKSQMKKADASGAEFAVIVGETELAQGSVALKALRSTAAGPGGGEQRIVPLDRLAEELVDALMRTEQL